jgi:hypothetical protein
MAVPNYQAFMAPDLRITSRTGCLARSYSVTVHPPLWPEIHRRVRDTLPPWRAATRPRIVKWRFELATP